MNSTSVTRFLAWSTWVLVGLMIGIGLLLPLAQNPETRGVFPAVVTASGLTILFAGAFVLLVSPFRVRASAVVPYLNGALAFLLTALPTSFWYIGRDGLAYQFFQAMRTGTAPYGFGDVDLMFGWLDCSRNGVDPYVFDAELCPDGPANYGPAFIWLARLGIGSQHAAAAGWISLAISALAVFWISRFTNGLARFAILAVAVSGSWVLLVERANLDVVVLWCAVLLLVLTRRMSGLAPWIIAAIAIWFAGAWKYYPFALVLALLPVVRIRRGWLVIAGFLGAAAAYLVIYREQVVASLSWNSNLSGTSSAFGLAKLAAFIGGKASGDRLWGWPDALIVITLILAFLWGWFAVSTLRRRPSAAGLRAIPLTPEAMLAIGGSVSVLVALGLGRAGYQYKAALLILVIPLLMKLADRGSPLVWRSAIVMMIFVAVGAVVNWNIFTTSLTVLVAAAFSTGAALYPLMLWLRTPKHLET